MAARRKTVLVVDDDAVFVDAVSAVLETRYRVVCASNGTKRVRRLRRSLLTSSCST